MTLPRSLFVDDRVLTRGTELLVDHVKQNAACSERSALPGSLPDLGIGSVRALETLAPMVLGGARDLGHPGSFAHMDPPVPSVAAVAAFWNAALNQNVLHPDTAPAAREVEDHVISWLLPFFAMRSGHFVPSSTVANIEALWAAREMKCVTEVVASHAAHISVAKAASLLGLTFRAVETDEHDRIRPECLGDLSRAALVLTAGTTASGAIDGLDAGPDAAWRHVDAAWAGPLRLTARYSERLHGIEKADSVGISAHKLLFQPKDSAMLFLRDDRALDAITFRTDYLRAPNAGLMGSSAARAVPLLATLLAFGRDGIAQIIEHCMELAEALAGLVESSTSFELFARPQSGCVLWRPRAVPARVVAENLQDAFVSTITRGGDTWLRSVAANPFADPERVFGAACDTLANLTKS